MSAAALARAAVDAAGSDSVAIVQMERSALVRFAHSVVHQPTLIRNAVIQLRVFLADGRSGLAVGNRQKPSDIAALAARARAAARAGAPSDHSMPAPASTPQAHGYDERTAAVSPTEQVQATATAIATARGLPLYGYFTAGVSEFAIATSAGPATSERLTDATFVALAGDSECSGWASRTAWQIDNVELDTCSREAVEKAQQTRGARASLPPGRYRAVLEPYALGDLLQRLGLACFGGAAFLEGRSLFSGRLGEQIFDSSVWIADDGLDEDGLPKSVDFEGVPKQRVPLVEGGVAGGLVWDRPTARRARRTSTGHARPPIERRDGPLASALVMSGGAAASVDELVAAVDDGVLITRVHYLGVVSEREAIITGMTRDGTFRIRRGRIAEPLVNHRFTVSMQDLFGDVIALSKERRLVNQSDFYSERYPIAALVPYLATSGMVFTGAGSRPGV